MDLEVETDPGTLVTGDNNPSRQARAVPTRAAGMAGLGRTGQLTAAIRDPPSRKGPGQYLIVREGAHDTLASLTIVNHYPAMGAPRAMRNVGAASPRYALVSSLSRATRSCDSLALLMRYSNSWPL
jgi:hypothetical protein